MLEHTSDLLTTEEKLQVLTNYEQYNLTTNEIFKLIKIYCD